MADKETRQKRIRGLLWAGFILLLLVVGLGPLLLVISYTRDINLIEFLNRGSQKEIEASPELPEREPYLAQYLYRYCAHHAAYEPGSIPASLELPPAALVEMAVALHENDSSIEDLMSYLSNTEGWHLASMRLGTAGCYFTFTYLDDLCPDCKGRYFLGIFNDGADGAEYIAVYEGKPPGGKVIKVTAYQVREDTRKELEDGVDLKSLDPEELNEALQGYTS